MPQSDLFKKCIKTRFRLYSDRAYDKKIHLNLKMYHHAQTFDVNGPMLDTNEGIIANNFSSHNASSS